MNMENSWKEMLRQFVDRTRPEWVRLFRYICVGLSSVLAISLLYYLLSAILFPQTSRTFLYVLVVIFVSWLNYEANSRFSFEKKRSIATVGRFIIVAVIATILNAILFWVGYGVLHLRDILVIVINCGIVTIFTFSAHRLFTFREKL